MWQIWSLVKMNSKIAERKYVLYEGKIWEVKEEGKGWLIITNGSRVVFGSKSDIDFCDTADDEMSPELEW